MNLFRFIAASSDRKRRLVREGGSFTLDEHSTGWRGAGDCQAAGRANTQSQQHRDSCSC